MAEVTYFGRLSDLMGKDCETLSIPANIRDTTQLRVWLDTSRALGGAFLEPTIRLAVNDEIVADPAPITDSDQIAFLPPVGGG